MKGQGRRGACNLQQLLQQSTITIVPLARKNVVTCSAEIFSWSPVARGSDGAPRAVRSRLWHREEVPEAGRGAPCRWRVPSEDPPDRRAGPRRVPGGSALVPFFRRLKDVGHRVQENPVHGLSRRRGDEEAHRGGEPSDSRRSTRTCAQTTPLLTRNSSCFLPRFAGRGTGRGRLPRPGGRLVEAPSLRQGPGAAEPGL